ncbi:hypothetical protein [Embleya sp. NPDC001921]
MRLDSGRLREDTEVTGELGAGSGQCLLRHGDPVVPLDQSCAVCRRKPTRPDTLDTSAEWWCADANTTALLGVLEGRPLKACCPRPPCAAPAHVPRLGFALRTGHVDNAVGR